MKRAVLPVLGMVAAAGLALVFVRWWQHVDVAPEQPAGQQSPFVLAPTSSHLSITLNCPKTSLTAQLEKGVPKYLPFDLTRDGTRVHGTAVREPFQVAIDVPAKRVSLSTRVSGHVQVEKRIKVNLGITKIDKPLSVGINFSGHGDASVSPVISPNWTIDPNLIFSAHADRAVVGTPVGDIDIAGHLQGAMVGALNSVKQAVEGRLKEALDVRPKVRGIWDRINCVQPVAKDPPTWLRVTPRKASFGQFEYASDRIYSGAALELGTHVYVQDKPPQVVESPLPDLQVNAPLSDAFDLSIPIKVSYVVMNRELNNQLPKKPINLPNDAVATISNASIAPYGEGILLTLDFSASKGWFKSASGRLYVVGIPVFDASKSELRVEGLDFTLATKNLLIKSADWIAHDKVLDELKKASVFRLEDELKKATTQANEALVQLKSKLPSEVGANIVVSNITVEGLAFATDEAFAQVSVRGKMSAVLNP